MFGSPSDAASADVLPSSKVSFLKDRLKKGIENDINEYASTSCIHSLRVKTIIILVVFFSFVIIAFLAVLLGVFPNEFVVCFVFQNNNLFKRIWKNKTYEMGL
jgi:hypothetical protein